MDIFFVKLTNEVISVLKSINIQTVIALVASLIAVLSLIETKRANKISNNTLTLAKEESDNQKEIRQEEVKAEILRDLSDEREICKEAWVELCTMKVDFDAYPETVKLLLVNYNNLFDFILVFEKSIAQIDDLYLRIKEISSKKQIELIEMKTEFYRIRKGTFYTIRRCNYCINEYKEQRLRALNAS